MNEKDKEETNITFPIRDIRDLRIVFMGTPEFAVASLAALVEAGCHIVGVVTAPDKPAGRGMKLQQSAVKQYAAAKGLTILQPEKLKNPEFLQALKVLQVDLQVVVAFRMLPEVVWNMPPMGTINVHASLLPQYRGAAPINWAVINGEKETGVTTFKLQHEIDTGNILLQQKVLIGENETAGDIHDKLKIAGAELLLETIRGLTEGTLKETPQSELNDDSIELNHSPLTTHHSSFITHRPLKHAPKIYADTCRIDWNKPIDDIYNLIRGLSPYPGAFTTFDNKVLKIYTSEKEHIPPSIPPGTYTTDGKTFLKFTGADGYILVKDLQLEGKKRMTIEDFLRGYRG